MGINEDLTYKVFTAASEYYEAVPDPKPSFTSWYYKEGGLFDGAIDLINRMEEFKDKGK